MKVTLNWLKEFIQLDLAPEEIAAKLTMLGLEVEDVFEAPRPFHGVVAAQIADVKPHPSVPKLNICRVDDGRGQLNIVCGAPNVQKGCKYPLARIGAQLGGLSIESRMLHDVISEGMLCSEAELGLSERSLELMRLPDNTTVGAELNTILQAPDTIFDIFITPNRSDCMSVFGIARELAAATGTTLRRPQIKIDAEPADIKEYMNVSIQDVDRCYRYAGRFIEGVEIAPSPFWLAERLHQVGIRSINNVVDITNFVMMETGQPLHAFDYALLKGKKILVRTALDGESFVTLDDKRHLLNTETLLICDGERPVALAGIMGGLNSEVSAQTRTVFLESAFFEPAGIRKSSTSLGIVSESSRRFERGIDPNGAVYAMNRAAQLLVEIAKGRIVGREIDEYPRPVRPNEINLSVNRCNTLLGTRLSAAEMASILNGLEIQTAIQSSDELRSYIPTFRVDLTRSVDLTEEIARCYGYDSIEPVLNPPINQLQADNKRDAYRNSLRGYLAGAGFKETIAFNLTSAKIAASFIQPERSLVELVNPLSSDWAVFRPNILTTLLSSVAYNRHRQIPNLRLFEIGDAAWLINGACEERLQIGAVLAGERVEKSWSTAAEEIDFYDAKGAVEHLLSQADISQYEWQAVREPFWDRQALGIEINGHYAGALGKVKKEICALYKIKGNDVFGFWLDFGQLYENRLSKKQYEPVPRFPSIPFDLALVLKDDVAVGDVEKAIWESGKPYLHSVRLFDYYRGEQLGSGKKSVAFSLTFSSKDRTLNEDEVNKAVERVLAHLHETVGAELRPS
ncbi:MAG: phenylalanine--tRNA ligase subunit beta [Calditrichaeota bacterium]|nr:MAG: phenylalanine--tRNA ligase subunit beta [Calditrichota bacterium]